MGKIASGVDVAATAVARAAAERQADSTHACVEACFRQGSALAFGGRDGANAGERAARARFGGAAAARALGAREARVQHDALAGVARALDDAERRRRVRPNERDHVARRAEPRPGATGTATTDAHPAKHAVAAR